MKSSLQIRKEMTKEGWASEDRLTDMGWGNKGKFGYSIWFERWNWHGKLTTKVCFHNSTDDLDRIDECVEEAAAMARKAWRDFPDSVPRQDINKIVVDELMTSYWVKAPTIEEHRRRCAEHKADRKQSQELWAKYLDQELVEVTANQYNDIKTIQKSPYSDKLHACYFQSNASEIQQLVDLGFLEYVDSFYYGNLMLKCTPAGRNIQVRIKDTGYNY